MKLNYRQFGTGDPLIIMHGLYGSSDNWVTIGKALSAHFQVFIIDQRNHGLSPHSSSHKYKDMRDDLHEFMDDQKLERASILGHSMGGKAAILFALKHPNRVSNLMIIDIAPKNYSSNTNYAKHTLDHKKIVNLMLGFNFKDFKTRTQIDSHLSETIRSSRIRQFLLKNLKRNKDKSFGWKLNIEAIHNNLNEILDGMRPEELSNTSQTTSFPTLFIRGEESNYITEEDHHLIGSIFSNAQITTIPNAGHWVHAQQPTLLIKTVEYFLLD